jgi:predicted O-methyltransferase YrrM
MNYILTWRRRKIEQATLRMWQPEDIYNYLKQNPGIRWKPVLKEEDRPINYLEIGVFTGQNVISVAKSFAKHPESKIYCVDPWIDYDDYPEYKGTIQKVYNEFIKNINNEGIADKLVIHRDFSHNAVPTFEDEFFDIAYIDGNHETEFVYKDGVMTLPKIKSGGYIIFDDYDWPQTRIGVNKFITEYQTFFDVVQHTEHQMFVKKL